MIAIRGKSKVISTSKIRKIIAIKKNRRENGRRAEPRGSNPHSKGELFSRSTTVFLAKPEDKSITALARRRVTNIVVIINIVTLSD